MCKKKKIFVVFVLLLLSLALVGCGNRGETPEQAVTNALNAIKNLDRETAQKYFDYEGLANSNEEAEELIEDEENAKLIVDKLSFKIISSSIEGDTATVKMEITNIDMARIFGEYVQQAIGLAFGNIFAGKSDEEIKAQAEQLFVDLLKRKDNKMVTSTINVKLTRNESSWKINNGEEFLDAALGGLVSAAKAMDENFGGGDSPESKLNEINNYVISDIWNKGFCDISHYLEDGKSSIGETMDIDFTLEQLADAIAKKAEYDAYINSLEDEKYTRVKQIWSKLSSEIDKLYNQIQEKKPTANDSSYVFDTGLFQQYMDAFTDEVWELNQ